MAATFSPKRVLIAIDFSEEAHEAFYQGLKLATMADAEAYVLHVQEPIRSFDFGKKKYVETAQAIEDLEADVKAQVDALWDKGGEDAVDRRRVHVIVRGGRAANEIVETAKAKEVDLVILAAGGKANISGLLGTTAERVVRNAPCSVLCVRA